MKTVTLPTTLAVVECATCCMAFGVPERFVKDRRADHKSFFCPAGHSNVYSAESDEEKARRLLAQEQQAHDQTRARARDAEAAAAKLAAKAKRLRTRAANGVCPCCQRSFRALAAHMKTKHPDYTGADHAKGQAAGVE
jgi:hypothetical protein